MLNDGYPSSRFNPLRSRVVHAALRGSTMLPGFTSTSQAIDRLARLEEAQGGSMSMNGTVSVRDERDERLERAGYLLVVGTDRFVRAVAAFVWRVARSLMKQGVTRQQIGSAERGRKKDLGAARVVNAHSAVLAPSVETKSRR
jgi:hypothetical protein